MNAFETAEKNSKALELHNELENLFTSETKSGTNSTASIPATFLPVTVKV